MTAETDRDRLTARKGHFYLVTDDEVVDGPFDSLEVAKSNIDTMGPDVGISYRVQHFKNER